MDWVQEKRRIPEQRIWKVGNQEQTKVGKIRARSRRKIQERRRQETGSATLQSTAGPGAGLVHGGD